MVLSPAAARAAAAAAALAGMALTPPAALAADRVIASSGSFVSPVEAYGGKVVWGEVAVGRSGFAWFARDGRGTRPLPLEDFAGRVDLGPRRGGGTRAVYVRCRPRTACVVRGYDFRTGARTTLASLSRLRGTEGIPSVWNDTLAFTRSLAGRPLGLFASGPLRRVTGTRTVSTDLRGSRVAYATATPGESADEDVPETTTVRIARLPRGPGRARSCFIARATGPNVALSEVTLTATHVLWMRRDLRSELPAGGTIRRRRLPARGCPAGPEEHSREIARLRSFTADRGRFFYTTNNAVWEATDPLRFTR